VIISVTCVFCNAKL